MIESIKGRAPYYAPRRKDPWEEISVSSKVGKVIREEECVRVGLRIIREKCGIGGIRHAFGVTKSIPFVAKKIGLSPQEERYLIFTGLMHDVGKAFLREDFSEKPGVLSLNERREMEKHPQKSFKYLMASGATDEAMICVRHHQHKNYPRRGLERRVNKNVILRERRSGHDRREDSPWHDEMSRLLSIGDIFHAMMSGCHDSRPCIICKDPLKNVIERSRELSCFSSAKERRMVGLLKRNDFRVLVV